MLNKLRKYLSKKSFMAVLLEVVGVILIWRGIWGLLDTYLFPQYPIISYLICLVVGYIFVWIDDRKLDELK